MGRNWTPGTPIGTEEVRNAQGTLVKIIQSGRIVAPQDQRFDDAALFRPAQPKGRVGSIISCSVEEATDMDAWTRGIKSGQEEDELPKTYTWSCENAGDDGGFVVGNGAPTPTPTGLSVQFKIPTTITVAGDPVSHVSAAGQHYTVKCVIEDAPTPVTTPDTGTHDDDPGQH